MLPDLDVLAFSLGIPYGSPFGHRGITHSLFFAAALSGLVAAATRQVGLQMSVRVWFYLFASIASHGLVDACTNGGRGIGLLIPLSAQRFFFPWRPIQVSPIGVSWFFSPEVWFVLKSELLWVWLPSGLVFAVARLTGHRL
jgi:inner membrane protein